MKRILFIGRFQPFHLGHLSVVKDINSRDDVKKIIIGIGSTNHTENKINPFCYTYVREMIARAIVGIVKCDFSIVPIPDINNNNLWAEYVSDTVGQFDEIYTGNDLVKSLFLANGRVVRSVVRYQNITGTKIRKMIRNGDKEWKKLVPLKVFNFLTKYAGVNY